MIDWERRITELKLARGLMRILARRTRRSIAPTSNGPPVADPSVDNPDGFILHNDTQLLATAPIKFQTPSAQWAYALELPVALSADRLVVTSVRVRLRVLDGSLGIGCVGSDGNYVLPEEDCGPEEGVTEVDFTIAPGVDCRSVVLRNYSACNRATVAEFLGLELSYAPDGAAVPTIIFDPELFTRFGRWEGLTPAGYSTDFLGVRTRTDVWSYTDEQLQAYNHDRFETQCPMREDEHALDLVPLLETVLAAADPYVMIALGAGWGRWLAIGAAAAQRTGREYRLVGLEAEPVHFDWMQRHFSENAIKFEWCRLVRAAAAGQSGACWFEVGNSQAWYGQSIVSAPANSSAEEEPVIGMRRIIDGIEQECVRAMDLADVVGNLPCVDYMHMDIQGSEYDFLSARPDVLQSKVKCVNVGTHSRKIERRLKQYFGSLGWELKYDVPLQGCRYLATQGSEPVLVQFGDGVQVWQNARLAHRCTP